jgi:transposase InsO family protein
MLEMREVWTYAVCLPKCSSAFKLPQASSKGRQLVANSKVPVGLVGMSCESSLSIEGVPTKILLDSGATVSTVVRSYYDKHFSHIPIVPIGDVLQVEVAGGHTLPYVGYVQVNIVPDVLSLQNVITGMLLVVDDTEYGKSVPVVIGTNILTFLSQQVHKHRRRIPSEWHMTFRAMSLTARRLRRNKGRIAMLHCDKQVTVPPNGLITINCYANTELSYRGAAVIEPVVNSKIPDGIEIMPTLLFHRAIGEPILVKVANNSDRPFTFQSKAVCAQMETATVVPTDQGQQSADTTSSSRSYNLDFSTLTSDEALIADNLMQKWKHVFSQGDHDVGFTDAVQHRIELLDETPFKQRYRRIPPAMIDEVRQHLQQLYDAGIIRPSHSPFASNLVLARKKDNSLRLCIDYRQLNQRTKLDSYALPRITEIFDYLSGSVYFSVLDMKSGYHQVPVHSADIHKTAFTAGPLGLWEFSRLPFGLTNSPATYQRLMETVFGGLYLEFVQVYLDDVLVFSRNFEDHVRHLELVFQRLADYNLKLAPKKCKFFKNSVKYLGHIVSSEGVSVDPEKTEKVSSWPTPTNHKDVQKFMGFANYYRRYIDGFAKIAQPLTKLLRGSNCTGKRRKRQSNPTEWIWQKDQQEAFDNLKNCLTKAPILAFPDGHSPFELHIDGSHQALGAVLYQRQQGILRVIAYGSRTVNQTEASYPAHKLEFLALKWAVTEKFHDYLYGAKFTVLTDNNPLTYVLTSAKLDATGHRWLAALSAYQFDIKYRSGQNNRDADALSRLPSGPSEIKEEVVSSICQVDLMQPWSHALGMQCPTDIDEMTQSLSLFHSNFFSGWKEAQRIDSELGPLFPFVAQQQLPDRRQVPVEVLPLLREFDKLVIDGGAMYRVTTVNDSKVRQILLPKCFRKRVLESLHDHMGHMGRDRTLHLARERFFWPGMARDVDAYVSSCRRCIQRKKPDSKAPLVPIETSQPLEIVSLDHLSLEPSKGGFQYVLVMTDFFTRYAVAVPVRNLSALTTAKVFFDHFVVHYGIPQRIHSDQGGAFESKIVKELCKLLHVGKSRTTPYHPSGNPVTERFNRTLINMLSTLDVQRKLDWKSQVGPMVHAYNCTPHASTQFSPYFLMFGRHPNLPIDIAMGISRHDNTTTSSYAEDLRKRLLRSYDLAKRTSDFSKFRHKRLKDVKYRAAVLQKGDKVLVKKLAFTGKHKLEDRWESEVHIVIDQPNPDIPVYVVKPVGKGRTRTLHRNHLLPVGELLGQDPEHKSVAPTADRESKDVESDTSDSELCEDDEMVITDERPAATPSIPDEVVPQERQEETPVPDEQVTGNRQQVEDSETDTAEESDPDDADGGRRYPERDRRPPDRYQAMRQSTKLDIAKSLVEWLNKE